MKPSRKPPNSSAADQPDRVSPEWGKMRVSVTAERRGIKRRYINAALWLAASVPPVAGMTGAHAQTTDLGTVQTSDSAVDVNSAVYQAPTTTPLTVTQPTSVIDRHYIEN